MIERGRGREEEEGEGEESELFFYEKLSTDHHKRRNHRESTVSTEMNHSVS
jgi:hypothetical protein